MSENRRIAWLWSEGLEGTLWVTTRPSVSTSTRSVKVPSMSTPIRNTRSALKIERRDG
jgi:hypothetical protein